MTIDPKDGSAIISILLQSVSEDVFKSKYRGREVVDARAIYYYLSKTLTNKSYYYIGKRVNRDHASAIHGFNQLVDLVDIGDKKLKKQLSEVKKLYNSYTRKIK